MRYIKTVIFNSVNEIENIEKKVNDTVKQVKEAGGKVISIVPTLYGISPMNLIYNIIYECDTPLQKEGTA